MNWEKRNEKVQKLGYRNMHHYRLENEKTYKENECKRLKIRNSSEESKVRYKLKLKKHTERISNYYIKRLIKRHNPEFKDIEIPIDLIELWRNKVKLIRLLKNGK